MSKKTFIVQKHAHHWLIDGAHEGAGSIAKAVCKYCGATTTFMNHIDWSTVEKRSSEPDLPELGVDIEEGQ